MAESVNPFSSPERMRWLEYLCERAGIDDYCRRRIEALDAATVEA